MKARILLSFCFLSIYLLLNAQNYDDYLGAGHDEGISVMSSDPQSNAFSTVDANGLDLDILGASRFLAHATLGFTIEDVETLSFGSYQSWIDDQMEIPPSNYTLPTVDIIYELYDDCQEALGDSCDQRFMLNTIMWRYAWWHQTMNGEDKLRQRVAMALSEILVLSDQSDLSRFPHGLANFYDIFSNHAFGNYKDILREVSLHPTMGFYLSHLNNPRSIPSLNIKPDENYAREIMQLFSIGLYELNNDGSRKVDAEGKWIPTYDNEDIQGLAKVFTGLSGSKWNDPNNNSPVQFGRNLRAYSVTDPMKMYEEWHEPGEKHIVGDFIIPAGQLGMQDVEMAIDHLFNHPNVGPFIAHQLIQRLVKSNPTAPYIDRVASVFNDNGSGVRGDMGAVIKAILLDEEAMDCYWLADDTHGKLRAPMLRYTQLLTGLKAQTDSEWFWNSGSYFQNQTEQHVLSSPTVFNFYRPDYVPNADFAYYLMEAPEFQIVNSGTASNYVNWMLVAFMAEYLNERYPTIRLPNILNEPFLIPYKENKDFYAASLQDPMMERLAEYPHQLVDYYDVLLANGQMSDQTRTQLTEALHQAVMLDDRALAMYAAFLVFINPDYLILK